jgi:hypothetical protein
MAQPPNPAQNMQEQIGQLVNAVNALNVRVASTPDLHFQLRAYFFNPCVASAAFESVTFVLFV